MTTADRPCAGQIVRNPPWLALLAALLGGCASVPSVAPSVVPSAAAAAPARLANALPLPYTVERFNLPGPVAGVLVRINLADPRVKVAVALTDDRDTDGDGPCVGLLDTTSQAARKHDFDIAINASFFAVPKAREFNGQQIRYHTGNCGYPVGWHYSGGKVVAKPNSENIRSTMVVHRDGRISLLDGLMELPADTQYAVSGNAMMLKDGKATPPARDANRHPRSAVGLSADAKVLFVMALDGRQETHSRGVTLAELAEVLIKFGAHTAINLDGGGSTALVLKDPGSGVYAVANQPSDTSSLKLPVRGERPVIDVVGITIN